ncbi:MAG: DsbA family protein [Galactobacter sp.]
MRNEQRSSPAAKATATASTPGPRGALESLETRLKRYRIATLALAIACLFLLIVTVAQLGTAGSGTKAAGSGKATTARSDNGSSGTEGAQSVEGDSTDSPLAKRDPDDPMAIGKADAPLVMVEYTDMRCPFCATYNQETQPELIEEYVDAGLLRIEVRDVAYFGDESADAAVAARAAGEQGKYFEYLDALYAAAPASGHPDMPRKKLVGFAKTAGVEDLDAFEKALDDDALKQKVMQGNSDAQQTGVTGVPFFVVGDQSVSGAQSIDTFRSFLDQSLTQAGATPPKRG